MENNFLHARNEFEDTALKTINFYLSKLQSDVGSLDRSKDENTFHKVEAQYIHSLREKLEQLAKEKIYQYRNLGDTNALNKILTQSIEQLLAEFKRQANHFG